MLCHQILGATCLDMADIGERDVLDDLEKTPRKVVRRLLSLNVLVFEAHLIDVAENEPLLEHFQGVLQVDV